MYDEFGRSFSTPIAQRGVSADFCSCFTCRTCVQIIRGTNHTGLEAHRKQRRSARGIEQEQVLLDRVIGRRAVGRFHLDTSNCLCEKLVKLLTEWSRRCETSMITIANICPKLSKEHSRSINNKIFVVVTHLESIPHLGQLCWRNTERKLR